MSAIDVGLGHAEVQVHESDISVKLTSSATFAPSEEDDIDYLHRMLKASIFERNTEALWIRRGHGFKLILSLDLNPLSNAADRAQVISVLTERIQASKVLWEQLHLLPSSVYCSGAVSTRICYITVHLAYDHSATSRTGQLHRLNADVPFYDVRPPPGVSEIACQAVNISISLSQLQQPERKPGIAREEIEECINSQPTYRDSTDEDEMLDSFANQACRFGERLYLAEPEGWTLHGPCESTFDGTAVMLGGETPDLFGMSIGMCTHAQPANTLSCRTCARVVTAALEVAICERSKHSSSVLVTLHKNGFRSLVDAMPTIWSPGYTPSVASRAAFIPTISHALDSVIGRSTGEAASRFSFGSKLAPAIERTRHEDSACAAQAISAQLWRRAQAALFEETAVQTLCSLWDAEGECGYAGEILEDSLEFDACIPYDNGMFSFEYDILSTGDDWADMLEDCDNDCMIDEEDHKSDIWTEENEPSAAFTSKEDYTSAIWKEEDERIAASTSGEYLASIET